MEKLRKSKYRCKDVKKISIFWQRRKLKRKRKRCGARARHGSHAISAKLIVVVSLNLFPNLLSTSRYPSNNERLRLSLFRPRKANVLPAAGTVCKSMARMSAASSCNFAEIEIVPLLILPPSRKEKRETEVRGSVKSTRIHEKTRNWKEMKLDRRGTKEESFRRSRWDSFE